MNITPHVVIETMMKMGMNHSTWREPKSLPMIAALIKRATLFDFGALAPSMEHKDFALDLYERQLFTLPFEITAFTFRGIPHPNAVHQSPGQSSAMIVVSQEKDHRLTAIMCTEQRDQDGRSQGAIPMSVMMRAKLSNPRTGEVDVSEETYPLISDRVLRLMYGDNAEIIHATMVQRVASNLVAAMGMSVMLMSKGVETELHPAPDRLNKAREKKGKPIIGDRYSVRIRAGDAYSISTGNGDESIAGHTRGAPRMHWRRGHFRTLYRGSEAERIVPVAPSLIGANDAAEPIRKAYKVS